MAKEVGMTQRQYWNEIEKACLLDQKNPVKAWQNTNKELARVKKKLTSMKIQSLHVLGKTVDLTIKLGDDRQWLAGSGANIPSFEVFATPDWRGTEGWIKFSEPLYYANQMITGIELEFKKGLVTSMKAKKGKKILAEMIKQENANKVGEFSLTDKRMSKITKPMGETLFDENMGGKFGNTHIALGMGYKDGVKNYRKLSKKDFATAGVNESVIHTDIISTDDRVVTATLKNGKEKVIYKDGMFVV
jgi:aminopeptidase